MLNTAKHRMLAGQPAIGAVAGLGAPLAAEILSRSGFDFVMVDVQHGSWDLTPAMTAFRAISLSKAIPMARAAQNNYYAIGSLLDRGALGIIVPMVNSADEAQAAVRAARYAPQGGRSVAISMYGHLGEGYLDWANDEIFLAVQIETAQGLEQAEEILSVEGVDGCWIGPMDLAKSMGIDLASQAGADIHLEAIMRVLAACHKTGKVPGIFGAGDARPWIDKGFLFVTTGSDARFIEESSRKLLKGLGRPVESILQATSKECGKSQDLM
jgi:4-hydroxy-2-oxoheptanedioate aldolase